MNKNLFILVFISMYLMFSPSIFADGFISVPVSADKDNNVTIDGIKYNIVIGDSPDYSFSTLVDYNGAEGDIELLPVVRCINNGTECEYRMGTYRKQSFQQERGK